MDYPNASKVTVNNMGKFQHYLPINGVKYVHDSVSLEILHILHSSGHTSYQYLYE